MKRLRILKMILIRTKSIQILSSFLVFILASAFAIQIVEPGINSYSDALWYCYATITNCGFGDFTAVTLIGRILSVILSAYAVLVIAIVTGVVVNYYNQIIQIQQEETLAAISNKLEHLHELDQAELENISKQVQNFRKKIS